MNVLQGLAAAVFAIQSIVPAQNLTPDPVLPTLVERLCSDCHAGEGSERDFDLEHVFGPGVDGVPADRSRLELAVQRVRARTMPPPDEEQPNDAERRELVTMLAQLAPTRPDDRIATVRRLTRRQYELTVRDLFGIEWRARDLLPEDAAAHGFDGQGDAQTMSPLMFEKYLDAAIDVASTVLRDPAARATLFPESTPLATALPTFLTRAFRRPVDPAEVEELLAEAIEPTGGGVPAEQAQHVVVRAVLASPSFIFRPEFGPADDTASLTAHEVAVRLAYMLTSSMPDAELTAHADDGTLLDPRVLAAQAGRLAHTHEGRRFAEDFAVQWLGLRDVLTATADFRRYPQIWNGGLRPAFFEEAVRFFAAIVEQDRSVLDLLDADYTYVNPILAKHYGLPRITGGFQRVALEDRRRGGLLGMGAMLMTTSYPLRTSPVKRGQWILTRLLDTPPPPPPPDAGTLPKDDKQPDQLTLRQRLEQHRKKRSCAACHTQMDALGFALENFDVVGRWRDEVHGVKLDTLATLPDGTVLDGPVQLRQALLQRADDFVRALAKNLLVHGVGRDLTLADEAELAVIVAATRAGGDRFSALLEAVVTSPLFTMRDPGASR